MKVRKFGRAGAAFCAVAMALGFNVQSATAQSAWPPGELSGLTFNNDGGRILLAQADNAQTMVRIQQLEEQIRLLNGQVEGLTFQLTQLQEILNRLSESSELRFQQLEGGGSGNADAATSAQALPQNPAAPATEEAVPLTDIPEQGVQPLPGEAEFDPTFDDGTATPADGVGNSADPLVGTGQAGGVDLATGQPLNLSYDPSATPSGNADADAQFQAGYEAIVQRDFAFAEQQFTQFMELYPDNPRVAEAASLLGEALLARSAYAEAAEVLVDAYQSHPESPAAADILLKLGMSLAGVGERETACRTFAEVENRYQSAEPAFQARLAEERAKAECPPV